MNDAVSFAGNKNIERIPEYRALIDAQSAYANSLLQYVWFVGNSSPYNPFAGLSEDKKRTEAGKAIGFYVDGKFSKIGVLAVEGKIKELEAAIKYYRETYVMPPEELAGKSAMIYQRQVLKHMENLERFADNSFDDVVEVEAEAEKLKAIGALLKDASVLVKGFNVSVSHAKNVSHEQSDAEESVSSNMLNLAQDIKYGTA